MNFARPLVVPDGTDTDTADIANFEVLAAIARQEAGLVIPQEKAPMVFARVSKRLKALGIKDRTAYCKLVSGPDGVTERRLLLSTLTTNVTSFFREAHHFDTLANDILPQLADRARSGGRVRLWSAGCSTGPEAFSIAMVILERLPEAGQLDVRILATDIDSIALGHARDGIYSEKQLSPVSSERKSRFFERLPQLETMEARYRVSKKLADLISFRELNLISHWPMTGRFDAIFCRNVVIYFDRETQNALWPRFQNVCNEGGYLFLGHSERIDEERQSGLQSCGTTTYRRLPARRP